MNLLIRKRTSRLLSKIHTFFLRNRNNLIGKNSYVYRKSQIVNRILNGVVIGDNCEIGRTRNEYHAGMPFYTTLLNDGINSQIKIGNNCRINGAYIHAKKSIEIGDNCLIAAGTSIIDSNAHRVNSLNRPSGGHDKPQRIRIGDNVWVGLNVIILKGTNIGNNCIVAAGSVVKGEFADNTIIQGNPAICVGNLHSIM